MDGNWALIVAAVVTAVGGILVAVLQQFRKENAVDHQVVIGMLKLVHRSQNRVEDKVQRVDERLSNHLESHLSGGILDNGRPIHQDGVEGNSTVS
jgi:hypothetical protein